MIVLMGCSAINKVSYNIKLTESSAKYNELVVHCSQLMPVVVATRQGTYPK